MEKIKIRLIRIILRILWLFPIRKKQVFFSAYEGKQYSCNPKIIYEKLKSMPEYQNFDFIWESNEQNFDIDDKQVKHNSFAYFFYVMTSKYIITNSGITCCIPLRKSQININTWHGGGAFKKVGYATTGEINGGDLLRVSLASNQTTYFLSSSLKFTNIMSESLRMEKEKFLPIGMPRNDIFFDKEKMRKINLSVRKKYNIEQNSIVVLYAPTYRGNSGSDEFNKINLNFELIENSIKKRFSKESVFLVRSHYYNTEKMLSDKYINVSDYPDMQELLVTADILITDYSSSIWDFGLSKKLCLLYVPDVNVYENVRGFYTPIDSWSGIKCITNEDIGYQIENYDEDDYIKKVNNYYKLLTSYDKGNACDNLINIVFEKGK